MTKSNFGAFIDDYQKIRIVTTKEEIYDPQKVWIISHDEKDQLILENIETHHETVQLLFRCPNKISLNNDYWVKLNDQKTYHLNVGFITKTKTFDQENYFDGWLGFQYQNDEVTFRVWSPVGKEVKIIINDNETYHLKLTTKGVYEISIPNEQERLDGASYYYQVRVDEQWHKVLDPYGRAISPNLDSCYIFDFNKTIPLTKSYYQNELQKIEDFIVYELNIRDFTITLPVNHPGQFLGLIESLDIESQGLDYLHQLGITHLQIMPVFAFGGVDYQIKKASNPRFKYNWGYNPLLYNSLCGWYVSDPSNPYCQINEFKQMVDVIHSLGLAINLDVVYNHVYNSLEYPMEKLVPGYTFRTYDDGTLSNGSWCGNDVATERLMNRKFIIDSLTFYQTHYAIDGFRFDLMGLIDIDTMKEVERTLRKNNPISMIYGEGWQMNTAYEQKSLATMFNSKRLPNIGFFNDYFRNVLKGKDQHGHEGLLINSNLPLNSLESLFSGGISGISIFANSSQSINYVECHDNYTYYDQAIKFGLTDQQIKENFKIVLAIICLSKGIPFIHSGQEVLRTKYGHDNSYNLPDVVNHMPWHLSIINEELVHYCQQLFSLRKEINFSQYQYKNLRYNNSMIEVQFENDANLLTLWINLSTRKENINFQAKTKIIFINEKRSAIFDTQISFKKGIILTIIPRNNKCLEE